MLLLGWPKNYEKSFNIKFTTLHNAPSSHTSTMHPAGIPPQCTQQAYLHNAPSRHTSTMHPEGKYCNMFTSPPSVPCHTSKGVLLCGTDIWEVRGGGERGPGTSGDLLGGTLVGSPAEGTFPSTSLVQAVVTSPSSAMGMVEMSWVMVSSWRRSRISLKVGLCWGSSLQHQHISSSIQRDEGWC